MEHPSCLHVPVLHEGKTAELSWSVVDDADGYVLERLFNEVFEQVMQGCTWTQVDFDSGTWSGKEGYNLTWADIENLPSTYPIYKGTGRRIRGPEQGLTWTQFESEYFTWNEIDNRFLNWDGTDYLPSVGKIWSQLESKDVNWADFEDLDLTWRDFEYLEAQGLAWREIEAHHRNWNEFELKIDSWDAFEKIIDNKDHSAADDMIPIGAKSAMYRIKAYSAEGDESGYLTTGVIPVVPILFRDNYIKWQVNTGMRYYLMIEGQDIKNVDQVPLTFEYDADKMELKDFSSHNTRRQVNYGISPVSYTKISSQSLGKLHFEYNKPIEEGATWSGCVTLLEFVAKKTGITEASLF